MMTTIMKKTSCSSEEVERRDFRASGDERKTRGARQRSYGTRGLTA